MTHITLPRAVVEQALEAWNYAWAYNPIDDGGLGCAEKMEALLAALEAAESDASLAWYKSAMDAVAESKEVGPVARVRVFDPDERGLKDWEFVGSGAFNDLPYGEYDIHTHPPAPAVSKEVEPVAEMSRGAAYPIDNTGYFRNLPDGTKLYTRPAPAVLTQDTLKKPYTLEDWGFYKGKLTHFVVTKNESREFTFYLDGAFVELIQAPAVPEVKEAKPEPACTWPKGRCACDELIHDTGDDWVEAMTSILAVPEGWQLVPKEPTTKMLLANWKYPECVTEHELNTRRTTYKAMLSAAPTYNGDLE